MLRGEKDGKGGRAGGGEPGEKEASEVVGA